MSFPIDSETEPEIVAGIQDSARLSHTYLILLLLSTLIATFGLLANSTATVIGAMIVAPLMGPILGIALGLVQGDIRGFRRSLVAEITGILLCLALASMLAVLAGSDQIDLSQSEIVGRTRPTLLDLAVGLVAGLAGAFCTVNRKVSSSFAGVAIAVALVPPLCVSGLCLGAGQPSLALGAFVLFGANYLTIQLAAVVVFAYAGLGHWQKLWSERGLFRVFVLNLALLVLTGWFLQGQLRLLLEERRAEKVSREIVSQALGQISGANLDSLKIRLNKGTLELDIQARAPEEVTVGFARQLQKKLQHTFQRPVELKIGTALASYVTPEGRLFASERSAPKPEEALLDQTLPALRQALADFPGVELTNVRQLETTRDSQHLFLSLNSPYLFDAPRVAGLQSKTLARLQQKRPDQKSLRLTVRTTPILDYTAEGLQTVVPEEELSPREERIQALKVRILGLWREFGYPQAEVTPTLHAAEGKDPEWLELEVNLLHPQALPTAQAHKWRAKIQKELGLPVHLKLRVQIGQEIDLAPDPQNLRQE